MTYLLLLWGGKTGILQDMLLGVDEGEGVRTVCCRERQIWVLLAGSLQDLKSAKM